MCGLQPMTEVTVTVQPSRRIICGCETIVCRARTCHPGPSRQRNVTQLVPKQSTTITRPHQRVRRCLAGSLARAVDLVGYTIPPQTWHGGGTCRDDGTVLATDGARARRRVHGERGWRETLVAVGTSRTRDKAARAVAHAPPSAVRVFAPPSVSLVVVVVVVDDVVNGVRVIDYSNNAPPARHCSRGGCRGTQTRQYYSLCARWSCRGGGQWCTYAVYCIRTLVRVVYSIGSLFMCVRILYILYMCVCVRIIIFFYLHFSFRLPSPVVSRSADAPAKR